MLVIGAAGGVGTYAVQIARALGAAVTGVCSGSKAELVRAIGAEEVIDYTREDCTDRRRRFDLIVDTAGRRPIAPLRALLGKQKLIGLVAKERQEGLLTLKGLIEDGKLTPVLDRTNPLSEAADAIRYLEQGHARGKVVLTISA